MLVAVVHDAPRPTWSCRELMNTLRSMGVQVRYARISRLSALSTGRGCEVWYGKTRVDVDAVLLRSLGIISTTEQLLKRVSVMEQLRASGTPVVNPASSMLLARDKYTSIRMLMEAGIPVPDTAITEDLGYALEVIREWGDVVIKPLMGALGYGSVRVSDVDVGFTVVKTLLAHGQPVYIQRYVEKGGRDIRVFTVGDQAIAAAYRIAPPGHWKTNVAQGAYTEPAKLTSELEELAVKASKVLGLEYAGVDVAETRDGYVVFEVNAAPQWRGLMEATGVNPAIHIARRVVELARR